MSTAAPNSLLILSLLLAVLSEGAIGQIVSPIPDGAQPELVTNGIVFGEGPLWHPDGFLLFTDVLANRVMKIDPETAVKEIYLDPSGGANGLALDSLLNLIMCRRDARDVARLESDGSITTLASNYKGRAFNGPNDLTVRSDGTIYFTDPNASGSADLIDGVYSLLTDGTVHRIDSTLDYSNGIALSPNEQMLYVVAADRQLIYRYDIESDSTLSNKQVFAHVSDARYLDGMKTDENGLVYIAGGGGVWIYSPEGDLVDRLEMAGTTTNLNFGDEDKQRLYITEKNSVHRIALNTKGSATGNSGVNDPPVPAGTTLMSNYPNPFNRSTTVAYSLSKPGNVKLTIINQFGQVIRVLERRYQSGGSHRVSWDGKDLHGRQVGSGIYIYSLTANSAVHTNTMVFIQ